MTAWCELASIVTTPDQFKKFDYQRRKWLGGFQKDWVPVHGSDDASLDQWICIAQVKARTRFFGTPDSPSSMLDVFGELLEHVGITAFAW